MKSCPSRLSNACHVSTILLTRSWDVKSRGPIAPIPETGTLYLQDRDETETFHFSKPSRLRRDQDSRPLQKPVETETFKTITTFLVPALIDCWKKIQPIRNRNIFGPDHPAGWFNQSPCLACTVWRLLGVANCMSWSRR